MPLKIGKLTYKPNFAALTLMGKIDDEVVAVVVELIGVELCHNFVFVETWNFIQVDAEHALQSGNFFEKFSTKFRLEVDELVVLLVVHVCGTFFNFLNF